MATFPEDPIPNYTLTLTPKWQTLISNLGEQAEQRTAKQLYPQFDVTVRFNSIPDHTDVMVLWDFYKARQGAYEAFYIYDPRLHAAVYPAHTGLYIDTADGSTDIFDIPGRSTSSQTIYADGVDQSGGFSILTGGGQSSSDRVDFTTAPTQGAILTCDFTGILRIPVRFAQDRLSFDMFQTSIFRTGAIELKGLVFG